MFEPYIRESLFILFLVSGIPLIISSVVGLMISALQSATQIQEQSITYTVKFAVISLTLIVLAPWFGSEIVRFFSELLNSIASMGRIR